MWTQGASAAVEGVATREEGSDDSNDEAVGRHHHGWARHDGGGIRRLCTPRVV